MFDHSPMICLHIYIYIYICVCVCVYLNYIHNNDSFENYIYFLSMFTLF